MTVEWIGTKGGDYWYGSRFVKTYSKTTSQKPTSPRTVFVAQSTGVTLKELPNDLTVARITVIRDLTLLREADLISFSGAPKNGRYVITPLARQQLQLNVLP